MPNPASPPAQFDVRLLAEHLVDILFRFRLLPDPALEYVSPAATRITGYTPEELCADSARAASLVPLSDQALLSSLGSLPDGHPITFRLLRRDGEIIWIELRAVLIRDAQGQVLAVEGIAREITSQIVDRIALHRYKLLSEQAREVVLFVRPTDGCILEANCAAVTAYGYAYDELLRHTLSDLLPPEAHAEQPHQLAEGVTGGILYETVHQRIDGSIFPVEVSATTAVIDGEPTLLLIVRDISARQKADAERDLLRTALEAAANAVVITNIAGEVEWANPAFSTLTGYSTAEVLGKKTAILRSGHHDDAFYRNLWDTVLSGRPWRSELINRRKNGSLYIEEMTITPVKQTGVISHFVAIKQEVTEQVERAREREALLTMAAAMRKARNRAELLPTLLEQTRVLLAADSAALAMHDSATGDTVFELGLNAWHEFAHVRLPATSGVTGWVMTTGELYLNNDAPSDPTFVRPELLNGVRAVICAPLRANETIIGALWTGRHVPFSQAEARMAAAIADLAAGAIHRATLSEQTERRLRRLVALRAIDHAITSSLDARLSLNVVLDQAVQQLGVDAAAVLMLNPHTLTLEHAASRGFRSGVILTSRVRLGEGLTGQAALERQTVVMPRLDAHDGVRKALTTAEGFESYVAVPLLTKGQVRGVLEVFHRGPLVLEGEWLDFLETLAGQTAVAIDNAELVQRMERANLDMALAYDTTLEGWSRALELRDKETDGHSQRVTELTLRLARAMGLGEEELVHIRRGALLHDIGKMGIPDAILLKPGPLTAEEREVIKMHPSYAFALLRPIAYLRQALDIPYCHHERWDGTGYPRGLAGTEIPLAARIFAVVDVYDAVTSDRPYQKAWTPERARAMIAEEAGRHFDPQVVEVFLRLLGEA